MIIQDFPDVGVSIEVSTGHGGVPVINVCSVKNCAIQFNGQALAAAKPSNALSNTIGNVDPRVAPTFWNPDGTQTTAGAVDLRGEMP